MPPKNPSQNWPSVKAPRALAALLRIGWSIKRQGGTSHRILERPGWSDILFAYHDRVNQDWGDSEAYSLKLGRGECAV